MNAPTRVLLIALLPLLWLAVLAFAVVTLLVDLVATPIVRLLRRPPSDATPASRDASIIVLNWNGLSFLRELMLSLQIAVARCPGDHEVIVVDNGSDDGSAEWLAAQCPWARLVRLPANLQFIRGNAAGAAVATRDIVVFLNNDMRVEPDWLVELLAPFGAPDLFATTSRIEMAEPRSETGLTRCFVRHGEIRFVQLPGAAGARQPALWAGGGSSAFDRAKHDAIGGFETLYDPCYCEDASLSWQAWRRGRRATTGAVGWRRQQRLRPRQARRDRRLRDPLRPVLLRGREPVVAGVAARLARRVRARERGAPRSPRHDDESLRARAPRAAELAQSRAVLRAQRHRPAAGSDARADDAVEPAQARATARHVAGGRRTGVACRPATAAAGAVASRDGAPPLPP